MIDRQGDKIIWECDSCSETFEWPDRNGFQEGWSEARRLGWRARKIGNDWVHACPACEV